MLLTLDCLIWRLSKYDHLLKMLDFCTLNLNGIIQFLFSLDDIWTLLEWFGGSGCWESTERDCPHSILQILFWSSSQEAKVPTDLKPVFHNVLTYSTWFPYSMIFPWAIWQQLLSYVCLVGHSHWQNNVKSIR